VEERSSKESLAPFWNVKQKEKIWNRKNNKREKLA
jgi:hypothetical protein